MDYIYLDLTYLVLQAKIFFKTHLLCSAKQTLYRFGTTWLEWASILAEYISYAWGLNWYLVVFQAGMKGSVCGMVRGAGFFLSAPSTSPARRPLRRTCRGWTVCRALRPTSESPLNSAHEDDRGWTLTTTERNHFSRFQTQLHTIWCLVFMWIWWFFFAKMWHFLLIWSDTDSYFNSENSCMICELKM